MAQVAANGFTYTRLAGASDPAYLAETTEIKLTPAIIAKAAELNHDPVAIHNWVRNNVEWLPTWGAMQTSEHTLSTLKGNAMDIASLTIALFRASGIPARYVHGTVDVPRDQLMNWAGGFTSETAAGDHISSGGIPSTGIIRSGSIHHYQMEHIWVEAAIDYQPSRGAVNRDADSWIAMDPSFKQYDHLQGMDLDAIAPFDAQAFVQAYEATTITDPYGGVTGGDPLLIQNAIADRQAAITAHIQANDPYATVADVIGGKVIQPFNLPHLASSLPYKLVAKGAVYGALPSALQFRISFQFQNVDQWGYASGGTPITMPMAELNNEKVTVSYKPATAADEQTLDSLIPAGITDINQLPTNIPAYLIKVTPELKVNGNVVMAGTATQMGSDHIAQYTIYYPDGRTRSYSSNFEAGTFHSVGIVGGSVSKDKVDALKTRVAQLQTELQSDIYSNLNKESVLGDMFYAGTLSYFTQYSAITHVQAQAASVEHLLQPSIGTMGVSANISYFFGMPRNMSINGAVVDVGSLITVTTAHNGNSDDRYNFALYQAGFLCSQLEHEVPERLFSAIEPGVRAASSVKLLGLAKSQGMPVYHITQANQAEVIPQLQLAPEVISEITASLAAGKEVLAHQGNLNVNGWIGAGYIIYDPVTGDGAYRISGGKNGAFIALFFGMILVLVGLVLLWITAPILASGAVLYTSVGLISVGLSASIIGLLSDLDLFFLFLDRYSNVVTYLSVVAVFAHFGLLGGIMKAIMGTAGMAAIATIILDLIWILYNLTRYNSK